MCCVLDFDISSSSLFCMYTVAFEMPAAKADASLDACPAALLTKPMLAGTMPLSFENVKVLCCDGEWSTTVRPISADIALST